jgi:5'(3')-deoxyribonucleotidase
MSDFRILLDVDGVLGDFIGHTLKGMGTLWSPPDLPGQDDFKTWNLFDTITDGEQQKFCNRLWRKKGWCNSIPPFPAAIHAVNRLRKSGEIYAVTAPLSKSSHWVNERYEWLQHWFFIPPENVIFAYDKGIISGDLFVDDKPANVCR